MNIKNEIINSLLATLIFVPILGIYQKMYKESERSIFFYLFSWSLLFVIRLFLL